MRTRAALAGLALAALAPTLPAQQVVQLAAGDRSLDWTLPEIFVVGDDEAREEEQFARIAATAFDAQDNLYILDADNGRIAVFDRTGRFVRQFGRKGEGPGELRFPALMAVTTEGHVVVLDRGNRALVVYTGDGKYLRNIPIDRSIGLGGRFLAAHPGGGVVFALNPGFSMVNGAPQVDTSGVRVYWQQSFAEGAKPVQIAEVEEPVAADPPRVERSGGATMVMFRQAPPAFSPQLHFAMLGDGTLAYNRVADYQLDLVGRPGQVTQRLLRPLKARKVTEADREAERKRRAEALRTGGGPTVVVGGGGGRPAQATTEQLRRTQEEGLRNLQFAETIPVVQGLFVDGAGRLWVLRSPPQPGKPPVVDIIGPGGQYAGTVAGVGLPSSVSKSGLAAYATINEYDVPVVVVRRIPVG